MGTHRLVDLKIPGARQILERAPDFDLYNLGTLSSFELGCVDDSWSVEICADYDDGALRCRVKLVFGGVKVVKLPELRLPAFFDELQVEDLSGDQLEGIKYRVADHGMFAFEVICATISIRVVGSEA